MNEILKVVLSLSFSGSLLIIVLFLCRPSTAQEYELGSSHDAEYEPGKYEPDSSHGAEYESGSHIAPTGSADSDFIEDNSALQSESETAAPAAITILVQRVLNKYQINAGYFSESAPQKSAT